MARWTLWAMGRAGLAALLAVWSIGSAARAEIYRWVDSEGRVHFTHDLGSVPPTQRDAAAAAAARPRGRDPIQRYEGGSPPAARAPTSGTKQAGRRYQVRVERAGTSMLVQVRLNDQVTAPFLIDTGASDVVVPMSVVRQLGVDLSDSRTQNYSTANGIISARLITLDSVSLGGARVEKVPAAVSESMSVGLLGLSYFNRFHYQIDPARGIVTLQPNRLEESGLIRGGRSEADWRSEYAQLRVRMEALRRAKRQVPPSRSRRHAELDAHLDELERQYERLESEADDARVPFAWRE